MDAETAKTVALLSGSFTLLGGLIAALVAGVINYVVARQNRETQVALAEQDRETKLALASAEARRDWRKQRVSSLLTSLEVRFDLYLRASIALVENDRQAARALLQQLDDRILNDFAWDTGQNPLLETAVGSYLEADRVYGRLLHQQLRDQQLRGEPVDVRDEEHERRLEALTVTARALHRAIEQYVFGTDGAR